VAQQIISNNETGLNVRDALNNMFTELYGAITPYQPIVLLNIDSNYTQTIPAGTFITTIYLNPVSGALTLNIGTTPNGGEILSDTLVNYTIPIQANVMYNAAGPLYFTASGTGKINITIYYVMIA
jgi:hypothetical protein